MGWTGGPKIKKINKSNTKPSKNQKKPPGKSRNQVMEGRRQGRWDGREARKSRKSRNQRKAKQKSRKRNEKIKKSRQGGDGGSAGTDG
jgi:hypothetical protein